MAASRKKTLFMAWYRAAAARSSPESVLGYAGAISYALPTVALGEAAFTARCASAWASASVCAAFRKSWKLVRQGGKAPAAYPMKAIAQGMLKGAHIVIRSPR